MRQRCNLLLALTCALGRAALAQPAPVVEEVPFITTPDNVTVEMLRIADVKPGDHVIDLGSGDGRIVITAAARFGASGLGVDIVPDLVRQSIDSARRAGVAGRTDFRVQDIFQTELSAATVVTLYLLPEFNLRLRPSLLALKPGTRIVSHDWDMGDWKPDRTSTLDVPDKKIGRDKRSQVHLWRVPAPAQGAWCGPSGSRLRITQAFQRFDAVLDRPAAASLVWAGRIDGVALEPSPVPVPAGNGTSLPALTWRTPAALEVEAPGAGLPARARFVRADGSGQCPAPQGPRTSQPSTNG